MKTKSFFNTLLMAVLVLPTANCLLPSCFSQGTWPWAKQTLGGGTGGDKCDNICTDASGNVYITGHFNSPTISFGPYTLTNSNPPPYGDNFYIAKYDANGNILWLRGHTAGTAYEEKGRSVATDAAGNVYVAVNYYDGSITFGSTTYTSPGPSTWNWNIVLVKYDASGNVLWTKGAGGTGEDEAGGVATDPSGNVYLVGGFTSPSITFGSATLTNPGAGVLFLIKFDASGNVLWSVTPGQAGGADVATDAFGNVYICGGFSSSITFGSTTLTQTASSFSQSYIAKYNGSGNALWAKQSVQNWKLGANAIAVNPAGTAAYIVGSFHEVNIGNAASFGSITIYQKSNWDAFFVGYDASSGNELCAMSIGEPGNGSANIYGHGVTVDASGNVYVSGQAIANYITFGSSPPFTLSGGNQRFFMGVFDTNCNLICKEGLGSGGMSPNLAADASGNVFVGSSFINTLVVGSTVLTMTPPDAEIFVAKYVKCTSSALAVSATQTNPVCNNICTGTATAAPSGGTVPYTYSWNTSPAQNTQTATGLCAGNYVCTVTDANGSAAAVPVTITQPSAVTTSTNSTPAACGSNNGSASVTASGGTGGLTYSWAPSGGNASAATGLAAGNYTCTVTDANGCTKTATVTVTQTGGPSVSTSSTPQTCAVGGTASANPSGGTSPYTYQWCNGQTTSTASGLSAGSCTVVVTDASGCSTANTVTITASGNIPALAAAATPASCGNNNGTASATVSGGTSPYTYSWNPSSQTTSAITGLSGGNYTCTLTDATGCTAVQTISVPSSTAITASVSATSSTCGNNNGTAAVNASGGTSPYTYSWSSSGCTASFCTGLGAGNYSVTITDATGCSQTTAVAVTQTGGPVATVASNVTITQGQSATLTAGGGGTYQWGSGSTQNQITVTPSATTVYCVTVTDADNCSDSACVTVTVKTEPTPCGELFIPNAFSPNSDGENEMECVLGGCIQSMTFTIYDRWGEKVFETTDPKICWDGMYKGKLMNTATFVYYLQAVLTNGEQINKKGNISLIR
ncbi:MAG: T9SS type B sorting domain-containing protein [Bacteroidetes bacterium]|nr:MAG: T9SS type B sorting domain-containing protein [Bacteroidota bacterium]